MQARNDPGQHEADLYIQFVLLAGTKHAGQVGPCVNLYLLLYYAVCVCVCVGVWVDGWVGVWVRACVCACFYAYRLTLVVDFF